MNTPTLTATEAVTEATDTLESFRGQVAMHYANILYSCQLYGKKMSYNFPLALTGMAFGELELQPHLGSHLAAKLNVEAAHLNFTYQTVVCKKEGWKGISKLETRLEIVATISKL